MAEYEKQVREVLARNRCTFVRHGKGPDGKRQYRSFTALTKKEAEYMAAQFSLRYKEISRDAASMTLAEAMDKYIASKDGILSPSTLRGYDIIRRNHLQGLMDVRLNRITPAMVQKAINLESKPFQDEKGKEHIPTPKSVRNIHGLLSAVLREYYPDLRLNTTLPQKQRTEQRYLEPEEIGVLLRHQGRRNGDPHPAGPLAEPAVLGGHRPDLGVCGF